MSKVKIINLKKDGILNELKDFKNNCLFYGINNAYPLDLITKIRRSRTASVCLRKLEDFVFANGFNEIGSVKVNNNDSYNNILRNITSNVVKLGGFALRYDIEVNDFEFSIKNIYSLPFENCRLGIPEEGSDEIKYIVYNPYFGSPQYRIEDNQYFAILEYSNTVEKVSAIKKYFKSKGFTYSGVCSWFGLETEYSRIYPKLSWHGDNNQVGGGISDMVNEYMLQNLLERDLGGNFLQNQLLNMIGDASEPATPEDEVLMRDGKDYTTISDELADQLSNFTGADADSMMILWSKNKEEVPILTPFASSFNYDKLKDVVYNIKESIASSLQVPSILVNIQSSGSISKDDIESATILLQETVRPIQSFILEKLNDIRKYLKIGNMVFEINKPTPFKVVPQYIFNSMSPEQQEMVIKKYIN